MDSISLVNSLLLFGAGLVVLGIASSLIASRFGAPLLLVFLVLGMAAGENGPGGIAFSDYRTTYLIGSLALAIILFDGGLRTRLAGVRGAVAPATLLATAGVVLTAGLTGFVAKLVLGLGWLEGLLVGSVVASTDAAAVFFLMRAGGLQLRRRVNATLEIESATNDPVAVFLVVLLVELVLAGEGAPTWEVANLLVRQGLVGAALGLSAGLGMSWVLNRIAFPAGLHPLLVVASAVFIYALAAIADGSGFLAVYLAGLVLGNRPVRAFASILSFHDAATWLCQIVMFLVLGLLVTPAKLVGYALPALVIALFLILVGRPVAVWLCLTPFRFSRMEKAFVSWVGLRGAVSIFLAAIPTLSGVPNAEVYFNVAFFVVLVSLLVQGWSVTVAARRSGVALADPAPEVSRVEIDLPGQLDLEMVGYPILADSPVMDRGTLPSWARAVLIVRGGEVLTPEQAGVLRIGDYGYFLAPPERVKRLDRLFAAFEGHHDRALSGVFIFGPEVKLGDLAGAYGIPVAEDMGDMSLGALFADTFEEGVREGDRIALGPVTLVARGADDGVVTTVALIPEEPPEGASATATPGLDRSLALAERLGDLVMRMSREAVRRSGEVLRRTWWAVSRRRLG
ncbi:potassium/proton antiporter [Chelatococcus sp. SYSU_G07232]|uniref:Potassium/proton antiporter n=1 Tax=Chelatococcus albus TaxID=3047466 RepID=A0ABT7AHH2_9HYPH|nr:potassium/proton antiporter [Chelatococcus sp. SYSU_G07232]MDJ1158819.1 potassium/proton antiporter [Chelatococcus sp. SYSU_G07232]